MQTKRTFAAFGELKMQNKKKYSIIAINVVLNPGKSLNMQYHLLGKKFQLFFTASFQNTFVIRRKFVLDF